MQIQDFMTEPRSIQVAERYGVPVAHVIGATTDDAYVGGSFFITRRVDGESVPRRVMRLIEARSLGPRMVEQCGAALAALHAVPLDAAPTELERPARAPTEEALGRLDEQLGLLLQPSPVFSLAYRWLERHLPEPDGRVTIVHGDARIGNMIVGDDGLRALLDWEIVRLGDPIEDVAWMCVRMWRFGNDDLEVGGFAQREELAAAYEKAGGTWDEARFDWWQILGTARWGVGLAHQARAHLDGSVPSVVMAASGRRVAEQEYDVLTLIRRLARS
jgi:aminoglycoside phosphotransferase (APT) family kinase protein